MGSPSGSSQCTSPKHPVSCIEPGLATRFTYDIIHVSMPFSQIIPLSPSPTESKRLFYTSVSLLLTHIQGYHDHLSKLHIYALVYCIDVFLFGLCPLSGLKGVQPPLPFGERTRDCSPGHDPGGSDGKESTCNTGDPGLIPGLNRSPGEGNGNHSSVLAWRIPGMGSLVGCRLWGRRVGHD